MQSFTRIAVCIIAVYCALMAALYFGQERFIFFPRKISDSEAREIKNSYKNAEEIKIVTGDKVTLHGWFVRNNDYIKTPLIIYFGGNAEELSEMVKMSKYFGKWSLALLNYRGYGLSGGNPGEKELFKDSMEIYDYFISREDIDKENIVIFGRSIGTGVAIYLAKNRKSNAVILVSPYDSLVSIARRDFPYAPVNMLLRHRFDSYSYAPFVYVPLLVLVGDKDITIQPEYSQKLLQKWGGERELIKISGADHNNMSYSPVYWDSITGFLLRNEKKQ